MGWINKLHRCETPGMSNGYIDDEYFSYDRKRVGDGSKWKCDTCHKVWVVCDGELIDPGATTDELPQVVRLTEDKIQAIQDATGFPEGEDG